VTSFRPVLFSTFLAAGAAWSCQMADSAREEYAGVSRELAVERARRLSDLRYVLTLRVPEEPTEPVGGTSILTFTLSDASSPLAIDFKAPADHLLSVTSGGEAISFSFEAGLIVIPPENLDEGRNNIEFSFRSADTALNRQREYLYSLFVPDRASTAYPCFDQPDLRAPYRLVLNLPVSWVALANGAVLDELPVGARRVIRFAETEPLSTYQFGFAAGRFQIVERGWGHSAIRIFHRERDAVRLSRNLDALYELHETALRELEEYTGIGYPYQKFDFALLPDFPFGGMEHPGAIFYRDRRLLLDASATRVEELGRASLIAHETAHMWFGNLVTMRWFDDVWMKEVFANFMAARIVNPSFPDIDHELRFLLSHHPAAYEIDRSAGTHSIRQELDNLRHAGSLYGPIIYRKAPVVMAQLEALMGDEAFRPGVVEYLARFGHGAADWNDLIRILDPRTDLDLVEWSRLWVEEAGRPVVTIVREIGPDGRIARLALEQADPRGKGRRWVQPLRVLVGSGGTWRSFPVALRESSVDIARAVGMPGDSWVIPDGAGLGYGFFRLEERMRAHFEAEIPRVGDSVARAALCLALWDAVLEGEVEAARFLEWARLRIPEEEDELIVQFLLDHLETAFWRLNGRNHLDAAGLRSLENLLWERIEAAPSQSLKSSLLRAYWAVAGSPEALERLRAVWAGTIEFEGLELSERDRMTLALELAVRDPDAYREVVIRQAAVMNDEEQRAALEFVAPAVSAREKERDEFFNSLLEPAGRPRETWVLEGLHYLNHPLGADRAVEYLRPALEALPEIERTGTIFFPKRWLDRVLWGHTSPEAARVVRDYLEAHPDLPLRLRRQVLQSADLLFRAAATPPGS
jgi:aminopeptidase N